MLENSSRPHASKIDTQKSKSCHFHIFIRIQNNFKKHCNSRSENSHITFQNTFKNTRNYVFKVDTATLNRMRFPFDTAGTIILFKTAW